MLNTELTNKCAISTLSLTKNLHYNVDIGNNRKGYFYVSLLKQQGNMTLNSSLSVFWAVAVSYIRYQQTISLKSYDVKIESFCFL